MKNNVGLVAIIALLIGGVAGFFGGTKYQLSKRATSNGQFGAGRLGNGGRGRNGGAVIGDILSVDNSGITVKLQDGSSKIVLVTDSTSINKAAQATKSDLTNGARVAVFGTVNADGSVTAQNVQLNPMFRGPDGPRPTGVAQ